MTDWAGCILQVKKRLKTDDGWVRNFIAASMATSAGLRLCIAVDSDVDIYSMDDIIWALTTRVNPNQDILKPVPGGAGQTFIPSERVTAGSAEWTGMNIRFEGGIGIDATVPYGLEKDFMRPVYPIDRVEDRDRRQRRMDRDEHPLRGWHRHRRDSAVRAREGLHAAGLSDRSRRSREMVRPGADREGQGAHEVAILGGGPLQDRPLAVGWSNCWTAFASSRSPGTTSGARPPWRTRRGSSPTWARVSSRSSRRAAIRCAPSRRSCTAAPVRTAGFSGSRSTRTNAAYGSSSRARVNDSTRCWSPPTYS